MILQTPPTVDAISIIPLGSINGKTISEKTINSPVFFRVIFIITSLCRIFLNYSWCVHDASKSDIANKLSTIPRFLSEVCLEIGEISPWCWLFSKLFEQNFGIVKVQPFSDAYSSCGSASLWMFSNVVMNSF